jgi:aldose sugar dehydrogenase
MARGFLFGVAALGGVMLASGVGAPPAQAQQVVEEMSTEYQRIRLVRVAEGLVNPWGMAFLPDGRMLVTERPGRLQLIGPDGSKTQVSGLPRVHAQNQGGLLDVVLHPNFAENRWVYLTYSKGDANGTAPALGRARLNGTSLAGFQELFVSNQVAEPGRHYGSRVVFLEDGTLLMTIGDRGAQPERAQDPRDHSGSVVRLNADGTVPRDNPFVGDPRYAPEIFSYGHRNIQGIVRHPETGAIWATEHGPRGSDLLQRVEARNNYGWPAATLGRDYRTQEQYPNTGRDYSGFTRPVFEFLPTLAPSGLAVVSGGGWHTTWQGSLLAGGLRPERILRLVVRDRELIHAEELLTGKIGRIRDVRQAPDGFIYIATEHRNGDPSNIYRIEPVAQQ